MIGSWQNLQVGCPCWQVSGHLCQPQVAAVYHIPSAVAPGGTGGPGSQATSQEEKKAEILDETPSCPGLHLIIRTVAANYRMIAANELLLPVSYTGAITDPSMPGRSGPHSGSRT